MNLFDKRMLTNVQNTPQWLESAGGDQQLEFAQLEQQLIASRLNLERELEHVTDLQSFARSVIADSIKVEFGKAVDPDQIRVRSRYVFKEGPYTIQHDDARSLTEFALYGLHDKPARSLLECSGEGVTAELSQQWLERSMDDFDIRAGYGARLRKIYEKSTVLDAMSAVTKQQILLSALSARLQGHLSQVNRERIQRAVEGAAGLFINGLKIQLPGVNNRPLKDLVVIGSNQSGQGDWLLFAPSAPSDREWHELPDFRSVSLKVGSWTANQTGCDYLLWQSHAMDRQVISSHLGKVLQLPNLWHGVELGSTAYSGSEVMLNLVYNQRAWIVAQEESVTPYAYRTAADTQRQLFARVNTELHALQKISVLQGGFVSYEKFCFDLIKRVAEDILSDRGERVSINPNQIRVEIEQDKHLTLTQLIVGEVPFYADGAGHPKYPRFIVDENHPLLTTLSIQDVASWSRTLRPGEKYIDLLRSVNLNRKHADGVFKRQIYLGVLKRKMYVAAMQSFFSGRLSAKFHAELSNIIAGVDGFHPGTSPVELARDVNYSAMYKLHIKGALVVGVFVFRLQVAGQVKEYVFTPDAPDGCEMWPFDDFVNAVKTRGYGKYFHEKVEEKYGFKVKEYLDRLEQQNNFTEAPTLQAGSRVDSFQSCYDDLILKIISDVDEKTTSLNEIIFGLVFNGVVAAATALSFVFPPVGIALSVVLFTKEALSGLDALARGDRAKALAHFVEALLELASLGKAGAGKRAATKLQRNFISVIGDVYKIEDFYTQATGQPGLSGLAKEAIQEILDDPQTATSRTTII